MRAFVHMLTSRHQHAPRRSFHVSAAAGPAGLPPRRRSSSSSSSSSSAQSIQQEQPKASIDEAKMRSITAWRLAQLQYRVHATEGEKIWQSRMMPSTRNSMAWSLKGVTFDNRQDLIQQLQPGQGVIFCKEPSNPADPHAVGVHTAGMQHLGYLPKHMAQKWQLQTCFGRVVTAGQAAGAGPWGALVTYMPWVQGICLDLLPTSWQDNTDLEKVLGQDQWSATEEKVQLVYRDRCAISTSPIGGAAARATGMKQICQPVHVVPQWQFDYHKQQVQLAHLIPISNPIYQLTQLLAAAADQLAHLSPTLQLPHDVSTEAGAGAATLSSSWCSGGGSNSSSSSDGYSEAAAATTGQQQQQQQQQQGEDGQQEDASLHAQTAAVHAAHAEAAAAAVASLPADQQEAFKWLAIYQRWQQVDCVRYVAYAGWRRQQLLQEQWQLVKPDAARLDEIVPEVPWPWRVMMK